jgi:hypothetical protein
MVAAGLPLGVVAALLVFALALSPLVFFFLPLRTATATAAPTAATTVTTPAMMGIAELRGCAGRAACGRDGGGAGDDAAAGIGTIASGMGAGTSGASVATASATIGSAIRIGPMSPFFDRVRLIPIKTARRQCTRCRNTQYKWRGGGVLFESFRKVCRDKVRRNGCLYNS